MKVPKMRSELLALMVLASGCVHVDSVRTEYPITTPEPTAETAEAAAEAAPVAVDDSEIESLPNQDPAGLVRGQVAPYSGVLISEYDSARYRLTDRRADELNADLAIAEWRLARTERRDAQYIEALENRVDRLALLSERRRRWMYILAGFGLVTGVSVTAAVVANP